MRKLILAIAVSLSLTGVSGHAQEDANSANWIMVGCRLAIANGATDHPYRQGVCKGAVAAIASVAPGVCVPHGATNDQAMRVVVKNIDNHPERLNQNFYALAAQTLKTAWPCQH
jgi:hypothetical protein